jgi:plastocyanin
MAVSTLASVLVAALVMVVTGNTAALAEEVPAGIEDYEYQPAALTVAEGDTVTWTNSDHAPHTVTSEGSGPLDSPNMQMGDTWSFTFTQAGTYPYYCVIHPDMQGSVEVTPGVDPPPDDPPVDDPPDDPPPDDPPDDPPPDDPPAEPAPDPACPEQGVVAAVVDPFWMHFQAAHLETSPGQQAADALSVDQYAETHMVLFEQMLEPLVAAGMGASAGGEPFWAHFQAAHLETSPGQQVADALDVDQYALTHTVLFEQMLEPGVEPIVGCG